MYLRYSSSVVAPMHWISPRLRAGLSTLLASMAPSAPPAPTRVCNSSMNRIVFFARRTSFITALMRSSNWPRYFVPATIMARSSTTMRRSNSNSGTFPSTTRWANPSTMAVLPTPASPSSTGLFFVRRLRICMVRSISFSRPITGSSLPCRANSVRSRPKLSRAGVFDLPARARFAAAAGSAGNAAGPLRALRAFHAVAQQVQHLLADLFQLQAEVHQHLGGHAFLLAATAQRMCSVPT